MQPGDLVFHYKNPYLRAVSVVTDPWVSAPRPDGYPPVERPATDGWLVQVEPIALDLKLHWRKFIEFIEPGTPGPLDRNGEPQQKYISHLSDSSGEALLDELGIDYRPHLSDSNSILGRPAQNILVGETDARAFASIRLEQSRLRQHLLGGRASGTCAICSRKLPSRLLVAGHIKPRSRCNAEERWSFQTAAMLICVLGCDALFEWGYLAVDERGQIIAGRPSETDSLQQMVLALVC